MTDLLTTAYTIIFIGVLLMVGVLVMAYVADPMGDQFYSQETVIAAGCSNGTNTTGEIFTTFNVSTCTGAADNLPIEDGTRAIPLVINCTGASCTTLTNAVHYNYSASTGIFHMLDDTANGTIKVDYWENTASDSADNAQQSITGTVYGGFDLATVMVIVMAAVAIVGTIFLIGRRGA